MARKGHHHTSDDLIKLTDSPMFKKDMDRTDCCLPTSTSDGCATGLLVDLTSDSIQVPYPKELLRVGEFDDTFGIYANQQRQQGSAASAAAGGSGTLGPAQSLSHLLSSSSPSGRLLSSPGQPFGASSPMPSKVKPSSSNKQGSTPSHGFSDSDSFLDIDNLSTFSISSGADDFFDECQSQNNDDIISPNRMSREIKQIIATEKADIAARCELKRRDSISDKIQRFNALLSSPIRTPPVSRLHQFLTPAKISYQPSFAPGEPVVNTTTSNLPHLQTGNLSFIQSTSSSSSIATSGFCTAPTSLRKEEIVFPERSTSPTPSEASVASSVAGTCVIKQLSFTSTTSTHSSPTSAKAEPSFNLRRGNISTRAFLPTKPIAPVKGIRPIQPLKAVAPLPSSSYSRNPSSTTTAYVGQGTRAVCASAPVTRKFNNPPVTFSSPSPAASKQPQTTPGRVVAAGATGGGTIPSSCGTPRKGRQSYTNVKSSGYGKPSPSRIVPASPPKFLPTPQTTPKTREPGSVMGVRGQIPRSLPREIGQPKVEPIMKSSASKLIKAPVFSSGLKKFSFLPVGSKENCKPTKRVASTLPRPNYSGLKK